MGCVCCFVLLTRYWGIVTVLGCPRVNRLQIITWGGRILALHLNYVAGYSGPLLFLFEQTHNCYVVPVPLLARIFFLFGLESTQLACRVEPERSQVEAQYWVNMKVARLEGTHEIFF